MNKLLRFTNVNALIVFLFWFTRKLIADENCFYNAVSLMVIGHENSYHLLQAFYSAELCLYPDFYASHPHFITILAKKRTSGLLETIFSLSITFQSNDHFDKPLQKYAGCVKLELNSQSRRWNPSTCLMALTSILGLPTYSLYPETGNRHAISPRVVQVNLGEMKC